MSEALNPRRRAWAEIDLSALRYNIDLLTNRYGVNGTRIMAVVKANAYGHGVDLIAPACWDRGIRHFGVATTDEALTLRRILSDAAIYILPPVSGADAPDVAANDIVTLVSDLEYAHALSAAARRIGRTARIHLDVDTGMGRSGFSIDQAVGAFDRIAALPDIRITGVATHFARADEETPDAEAQHALFLEVLERLGPKVEGLDIHAANSPGILVLGEPARHQLIRAGLLLYGIEPRPGMYVEAGLDLRPVLSLRARVFLSRELAAGATISYGKTYTVPEKGGCYATVPIGYGDGLSRLLSNVGAVGIGGRRAPIRGRVCMDQIVVEVTRIPEQALGKFDTGEIVTVIGTDGDFAQTAGDIAALTGQTPHEVTTMLLPRITRINVN